MIKGFIICLILYLFITIFIIHRQMKQKAHQNYHVSAEPKMDQIALIDKPKQGLDIRLNLIDQAKDRVKKLRDTYLAVFDDIEKT